jgi:hypothetical protein
MLLRLYPTSDIDRIDARVPELTPVSSYQNGYVVWVWICCRSPCLFHGLRIEQKIMKARANAVFVVSGPITVVGTATSSEFRPERS